MKDKNNIYNLTNIVSNFLGIQQMEQDLESMIKDDVLEIHVDEEGRFHYQVTDLTYETLKSVDPSIKRNMQSFEDMLATRGLNTKMFKNFYDPKKFKP